MPCPSCGANEMEGAGAQVGGRVNLFNFRCRSCENAFCVFPMSKKYEYGITATTAEERKEKYIQKVKDEAALELAKRITQIQEQEF